MLKCSVYSELSLLDNSAFLFFVNITSKQRYLDVKNVQTMYYTIRLCSYFFFAIPPFCPAAEL